jgi:hypothetical protein
LFRCGENNVVKINSSVVSKILLVACGTVVALLSSELLLRAFNVDFHLLRKTLYYQNWSFPLHRTSSDAQRLFELVPNVSVQGMTDAWTHPKETKYRNRINVSINVLGFRGKNFEPVKKAGVFRIVVFGGSNTFGPSVNDEDTYPAQMQKIFDKKYPGKVEVWNAGISAYVMSQDVAYAETVIKKFDPDLLILQDTNRTRRAFYGHVTDRELRELFGKNSELFMENMPFWGRSDIPVKEKMCWLPAWIDEKTHYSLAQASALYRTIHVSLYAYHGVLSDHPADPEQSKYAIFGLRNAQMINDRKLNLFAERHKDKKIILFFITESDHETGPRGGEMRDRVVDFVLNAKDKPPEYQELHPPSYVYAWYAREFCNFLVQKGYIPTARL